MTTSALSRTVSRIMASIPASCPACRDWPTEIGLKIVTEIIEVGQPIPPPDRTDPSLFGPCECCKRVHRARVIALED
jgi:hypothetical protein